MLAAALERSALEGADALFWPAARDAYVRL